MPVHPRTPIPDTPTATSLFGGAPYQTSPPSQGSINLYQHASCGSPLADNPTPLLAGYCLNMPLAGIAAVSINSLPECPNYGTPLLIVSNRPNCQSSTAGTAQDSGAVDTCQSMSTGADVGSVRFVCYGDGVSQVDGGTSSRKSDVIAVQPTTSRTGSHSTRSPSSKSGGGGGGDCCCACDGDCCCCVVM